MGTGGGDVAELIKSIQLYFPNQPPKTVLGIIFQIPSKRKGLI